MWYYLFKYIFMGPALRLMGRPRIEGLENIPKDGAALIASNHMAVVDSFYLPLMVPRRIFFLAKSEYFTEKGLKGRFKKWFFSTSGQIPIDRSGASAAADALLAGKKVLEDGRLLCLYPEGTRSPDGRLYKGKTGLARIALETGTPVIPIAMVGTDRINPPGTVLPRPTRIVVRVGEPLDFSRYEGMAGNRFIERAVTDEIMYALMRLGGQQYVDVYAASLKNAGGGAKAAAPTAPAAKPGDAA
ncbi:MULTISPECIES: lysophospholipid acyltransferase family protein [Gordonia]|uniref:Putative acyltransferase n=1 Tax=Gordonia sihwensis NBRC 108236 TaxID=1223544 RepID=L7LGJ5_9ACTN|nr:MULTISPECIES: lysophospholipid acyltransferase family protein [Gordonia]AUH68749.1 1-acyl-sn-glycerol-3-phosphate acyltransferase [Gordonia sp. YC-JH1]KJR05707.1 acyl-phosphate glycerol 3-phosphate acyltransferase [Gordonia sihwensis]MBY4571345.1 1-acyl-sn-glycerol-3-phosphate acyltransferase [Gordonia sihwensis]WFN91390.1 lysophospholipid acyltransferase family protein [Gordonia sihwensis]GAC59989.1 putative acyltransferase [Gordonia sihwensis NBRC 108236]